MGVMSRRLELWGWWNQEVLVVGNFCFVLAVSLPIEHRVHVQFQLNDKHRWGKSHQDHTPSTSKHIGVPEWCRAAFAFFITTTLQRQRIHNHPNTYDPSGRGVGGCSETLLLHGNNHQSKWPSIIIPFADLSLMAWWRQTNFSALDTLLRSWTDTSNHSQNYLHSPSKVRTSSFASLSFPAVHGQCCGIVVGWERYKR